MAFFAFRKLAVTAAVFLAVSSYPSFGDPINADASQTAGQVDAMQDVLLLDAKAAWTFFERKSNALPGLASPNIWSSDGGASYDSYDIVTMWDIGSILLATVSARSLELINATEFEKRIAGLLAFIERATHKGQGVVVPNFRSKIESGQSFEDGYDATDTGRLYVALHILDRFTDGKYKVADIFKSWTIDKTIKDGVVNDLKLGTFSPAQSNIYRYYVSRGHKLWSIEHAPPYKGDSPDKDEASRLAFLQELAGIGPIASEPSVVEHVELGPSAYSAVIADELDKRQRERYAQTGKLTSVSETPIDRAPWFTYQGLDLNRSGEEAWTVYPYLSEKKWATPEFAIQNRIISTKAAYLWYAMRPDEYTLKVLTLIREKARAPKFGFYPGLYEATGKPTTNIDLNTNAMVLEAVAFIINGRRPMAAWGK